MCVRIVPLLLLLLINFYLIKGYHRDPGPRVKATAGEVWPKPQKQIASQKFFFLDSKNFRFQVLQEDCARLEAALGRYYELITNAGKLPQNKYVQIGRGKNKHFMGFLNRLNVLLLQKCYDDDLPYLEMDESYVLTVNGTSGPSAILSSKTIWGILRGLETFSQLLYSPSNEVYVLINETFIDDFPRYPHRGLLIDTSRHFLPLNTIRTIIDGMVYNKLNVLHWHITDDESFPYKSKKFPELSDKGAYHPVLMIYTQSDVQHIINYAADRGIRILPEFDTPGHTRSWGEGVRDLLTACDTTGDANIFGPINPVYDFTYSFMEEFLEEVVDLFPDKYLHLGGDEVEFECWQNNTDITSFMERMNISGNYEALESYYIERILNIANKLNSSSVVWQEVFDNGVKLQLSTIVHVWKSPWRATVYTATEIGYRVLLSSCWYLDHLSSGGDWQKFYSCEPSSFAGSPEQNKLLLGGEACMWAEVVNEYNVIQRIFPRVSATAEKLWSPKNADDINNAAKRLEEHTCRMNKRGIPAQPPNGAGLCL